MPTSRETTYKPRLPGIAASAAQAIIGAGASNAGIWLHYVFKPLTTLLILLRIRAIGNPVNARYRRAVLTGVALSLVGDIFLMLPASVLPAGFMLGLVSFLIAHLFFLRALSSDVGLFARPGVIIVFLLVGAVNLAILWPGLAASLKIPVVAYMLCLIAMTSQAAIRYLQLRTRGSRLAAIGGMLFMLSDTILAYNKFYLPVPASALLILVTYYAAVFLIADSVAAEDATNEASALQGAST